MGTYFYKGKENILDTGKKQVSETNNSDIKKIQDAFLKVLDNKNLSFLLGSGCSSFEIEKDKGETDEKEYIQVGIPVMCPLAKEFYNSNTFVEDKKWLKDNFNPTIFNYALAEKMDLSQSKWSVIDNFFYLYKIHGSVNWIEAEGENKLFKVKEIQEPTFENLKDKETMIYPTPLKYNASFGSPYSDLFREFQRKLMINNNILVTIGYSFNDEHINNLIFQAFTIPSFRLIIIGEPMGNIEKLKELDDTRIWIIGGKEDGKQPLHFFERFVNEILPDLTNEDLDKKMEITINNLKDLLK